MSDIEVKVTEATDETISPYGRLIDITGKKPTFDSEVFRYWDAVGEVDCAGKVSFGVVESYPGVMEAVNLERHAMTSETLIPTETDIVLVVGAATDDEQADLSKVAAFRIPVGKAVTLRPGTWHYVPLVEEGAGKTIVVFRAGTPDSDLLVDEFKETRGQTIRVVV